MHPPHYEPFIGICYLIRFDNQFFLPPFFQQPTVIITNDEETSMEDEHHGACLLRARRHSTLVSHSLSNKHIMKIFNTLHHFLTLLFVTATLNVSVAQLFETTIGDLANVETTRDGKALPNGHYVMLSNTLSFGPDFQIMLTELDPTGNVVNVVSLHDPGNPGTDFFANAFELDLDTAGNHIGYFITGHRWGGNTEEMILIRTDVGGYLTWAQRINVAANGTVYSESGVSIERQKNGDVVVIGRSKDLNSGARLMVASRVTATGTVIWANRYDSTVGGDLDPVESCNGVRSIRWGLIDVVAVTGKYKDATTNNTFVSLINANAGFEIYRKVYISNGAEDIGLSIVQNPNNYRYMVVGESVGSTGNSVLWVANLNGTNLNLNFANTYDLGSTFTSFAGRDVCLGLSNNTAVIAGMLNETTPIPGVFTGRTFALELPFNSTAMPAWFYSYTDSDPNPVGVESIVPVTGVAGGAPGGYFITTDAFLTAAATTDQHAIRVDATGQHHLSSCPEVPETPARNPGGQFYSVAKNKTATSWVAFDLETAARDLTEEPCAPPVAGNGTGERSDDDGAGLYGQPATHSASLFPNPVKVGSEATLTFDLPNENEVSVGVYDVAGKRHFFSVNYLSAGHQQVRIPTFDLVPGTYFVRLTTAHSRVTSKLHIQR